MVTLGDIVQSDTRQIKDVAIHLDSGLDKAGYVNAYTPTRSAIDILRNLHKAVQPSAAKETRAMNWHGPYGAGKSHLAVVVGRLLRDGSGGEEFAALFSKLENLNEAELAKHLRNTFLEASDRDAKPYLLVTLYQSSAHPLAHQLLAALHQSLGKDPHLNRDKILAKTIYDAASQRFAEIVERTPQYQDAELSQWGLVGDGYLTTADMANNLQNHDPTAYAIFERW